MFSKTKGKNYVDLEVKKRGFVPGIGKYKEVEKGLRYLSKPITSLRRLR
jgi:hypothetical protein